MTLLWCNTFLQITSKQFHKNQAHVDNSQKGKSSKFSPYSKNTSKRCNLVRPSILYLILNLPCAVLNVHALCTMCVHGACSTSSTVAREQTGIVGLVPTFVKVSV